MPIVIEPCEGIFVHKNCHTAEATLEVLRAVFENRIISRRADVVWSPLDYYLFGAVKVKCYADKPETIV